jgi:hypothetical protein
LKYGFYLLITLSVVFGAYHLAQSKLKHPLKLEALQLGMTTRNIEKYFGSPAAINGNHYTYILTDGSELSVTLREGRVSSAKVKFRRLIKIQDPQMKLLTMVQMQPNILDHKNPSWFFAGNPSEGLIYKIKSDGVIESLTWVPPFTYGTNRPKQLQALLRDFNSQRRM